MELYQKLHIDFEASDIRGKLVQIVHGGYQQVNVLYSKKGTTRGGHYHKISSEAFFVVSGCVEVTLQKEDLRDTVVFQANDFFLIEPYVVHSMTFREDCVLVALYDVPVEHNDGTKDIYAKEIAQ